jgi:hypothetical protein
MTVHATIHVAVENQIALGETVVIRCQTPASIGPTPDRI